MPLLLFDIVRWAGAAYLLWLAWDAVPPARQRRPLRAARSAAIAPRVLYRTGILTSILNPKVALFYLALFPQFVDPRAAACVAVAGPGRGADRDRLRRRPAVRVLAAASVARWLAERPAWVTAQRWVLGGVFGAIAIKLALDSRR